MYLLCAVIPFAIQTWARYDIRIFVKSGESDVMKHANTEHALCILNHRGDMDWAVGWCINDRIGMLTVESTIMFSTSHLCICRHFNHVRNYPSKAPLSQAGFLTWTAHL